MALYCIDPHYRSIKSPTSQGGRKALKPYREQINVQVLAETHFDDHDFDLALAVYHEQIHLFGRNARILFNIAQIHLLLGEKKESVSWFENAAREDPYLAAAFFQLGGLRVSLGDFARARTDYGWCRQIIVRGEKERFQRPEEGYDDVKYDQVGMRYCLRVDDIEWNQRLCAGANTTKDSRANQKRFDNERIIRELSIEKVEAGMKLSDSNQGGWVMKGIVMISADTIFRVPERKAKARKSDPAKTAVWRFRNEARVVAMA